MPTAAQFLMENRVIHLGSCRGAAPHSAGASGRRLIAAPGWIALESPVRLQANQASEVFGHLLRHRLMGHNMALELSARIWSPEANGMREPALPTQSFR